MKRPAESATPGLAARRAALRVLDGVLRRGQALEAALGPATRDIDRGDDRALAHAIAAETLRRLPDLDALIDSATRQNLPDDAKARFALRIALVQALALGTPPHAAISTVLPLVDGGPRKLVHGVFGTLMRGGATLPDIPTLPDYVAMRWEAAWGPEMVAAAAHAIAAPPPLDLTLADPAATEKWVEELGGSSLMPGHVRLAGHASVPELPGFEEGAWWVQDIAASLPCPIAQQGRRPRDRSVRCPRREDVATRRGGLAGHFDRQRGKSVWRDFAKILSAPASPPRLSPPTRSAGNHPRLPRRCCSTRRAVPPASSAAIPMCSTAFGHR